MIQPREFAAVVSSQTALVVAGGECKTPNDSTTEPYCMLPLDTVEVMNTDTEQWLIADSCRLPQPLTNATTTVWGETICLVGGRSHNDDPTKSVFVCPLNAFSALLQPQIISAKRKTLSQAGNHTVWSTIADLPVEGSTCLTLNGQLLAVGGCEPESKMPTNNIFLFNNAKQSWDVVGHIPTPRYQCLLTVLSYSNQLIVMVDTETDNIEIATVDMW